MVPLDGWVAAISLDRPHHYAGGAQWIVGGKRVRARRASRGLWCGSCLHKAGRQNSVHCFALRKRVATAARRLNH